MQALFQPYKNISPCFLKIGSLGRLLWSFDFLNLYPFFNTAPCSLSTSLSHVLSTSFLPLSLKSFSQVRRNGFYQFSLTKCHCRLIVSATSLFCSLKRPFFFISHKCEPCISLQASIHLYALIFLFFSISFVLLELLWFSLSADSWLYKLWCPPRTLK